MEPETITCEERVPNMDVDWDGVMYAGRHGETDRESLEKVQKRKHRVMTLNDYRECIPCEKCSGCIEIRGFSKSGNEKIVGHICKMMDIDVDATHTCNMARLPRKPYRRVVYILENAPVGFKDGLSDRQIHQLESFRPEDAVEGFKVESTVPMKGYKGGTGYYKRADGDKEAEGTGKIPRRLMN